MGWVGEKAGGGDCQCMLHGETCRIGKKEGLNAMASLFTVWNVTCERPFSPYDLPSPKM